MWQLPKCPLESPEGSAEVLEALLAPVVEGSGWCCPGMRNPWLGGATRSARPRHLLMRTHLGTVAAMQSGDPTSTSLRTSPGAEREEQGRWRLRPRWERIKSFDQLIDAEFAPPEALRAYQDTRLREIIAFSATAVPYYQQQFLQQGMRPGDVQGLAQLPRLSPLLKEVVQERAKRLMPRALPQGEKHFGWFSSSGTTGRPTRVVHSVRSNNMFTLLAQRFYRWFRWDPLGTLAVIRPAVAMPGKVLAIGETALSEPSWRYGGAMFFTGPYLGFNTENSVEAQLAWIRRERPNYIVSLGSVLEALAIGAQALPVDSLHGVMSIGECVHPGTRARIEQAFGLSVQQNYGFNEIGLVATRCAAGRYHVNVEHCVVEVADDQGQPCAPGETGRLLVTALNNLAMPLLRYDTTDLAVAVEGPCACGRTLPSFGEITGRYRPLAYAPEGTSQRLDLMRRAFDTLDLETLINLRAYQLHQSKDNTFQLRLQASGPLSPALAAQVVAAWTQAFGAATPLSIVEVDHIQTTAGGKQQDVTSDFFPPLT